MGAPDSLEAPDIRELKDQLDAAEREAQSLVTGLPEELGVWRSDEHSWSVAQCLDHLARTNEQYVQAMQKAGDQGRREARLRRCPAVPGIVGRWFAGSMEPPVKRRMKAPGSIEPSSTPSLTGALESFRRSLDRVRALLVRDSDLDLASIRFSNPFVRGIRFTVATGLHILTAHQRRHLWQAWNVRTAAEGVRASR